MTTLQSLSKCRVCLTTKLRQRSEYDIKRRSYIYRDQNGHRWDGNMCRDCAVAKVMARNRAKGTKSIDEVTAPHFVKARRAERLVRDYYQAQGFTVEMTTCRGPDLTCSKSGLSFTVEVKSASRVQKTCWKVGYVDVLRRNDDLIAIVLPDDRIHIEDMKEHLLKCQKSGDRSITRLVHGPIKALACPSGHQLTGDNLYIPSDGWRRCRQCRREAQKRWARAA